MALDWGPGFGVNLSLENENQNISQSLRNLCYYSPKEPEFSDFVLDKRHLYCSQMSGVSIDETFFINFLDKNPEWTMVVIDFILYERLFVSDIKTILFKIFPQISDGSYSKLEKNLAPFLDQVLQSHLVFLKLLEALAKDLPPDFMTHFINSFSTTNKIFNHHEQYLSRFLQNESLAIDFSIHQTRDFSELLNGRVLIQLFRLPVEWLKKASSFSLQLRKIQNTTVDLKTLKNLETFAEQCQNLVLTIDSIPKLEQLAKCFVTPPFPIVVPGRRFIKQGVADKHCRKKVDHREIILFSDYFVYAQNKGGMYLLPQFYDLNHLKVEEKDLNSKCLYIYAPRKSFVLEFSSIDRRHEWYIALFNGIANSKEKAIENKIDIPANIQYAPIWIPDKETTSCMICNSKFSTLNRKHHCRVCGSVLCKNCLPYKMIINNISTTKPVLVCQKCHDESTKK